MSRIPGNKLELGIVDGAGVPLEMTPEMRSTHLYICGATGTGKSKMLESLVRQDIRNWHKTKCGALIIDPHGSLYNSIINWTAWNEKYLKDVPIVPIDLRQKDWTIGYNVMRQRSVADPAVVISNFVLAMAYVWDTDGTQQTPLFARICKDVLWTLYENGLTLIEVEYLLDRVNKRIRGELTQALSKNSVVQNWHFSDGLLPRDRDAQWSSTINRFHPFLEIEKLRLMFGQNGHSLDLGKAIEEGQIIIANVSTEGGRASEEGAALFATVLLSDLWMAAKERGKGENESDVKPFYVYVDEFQNFITPTIAKNLDQARGFGMHLTLANQFPRQILHAGAHGPQVYDSIMANARSKIVFSLDGDENLMPLAQSLFRNVIDPDLVKLKLFSRKIVNYVEEERTIISNSESWSEAEGDFTGDTDTDSLAGAIEDGAKQEAQIWNSSSATSLGASHMSVRGGGKSETNMPFLRPVFADELSSVQYRTLEEQLFMAMRTLADQKQRHGVARLIGMRAPLNIVTPTVEAPPTSSSMKDAFLTRAYAKLPFALPSVQAAKQIADRQQQILNGLPSAKAEPETARRKIQD